MEQYSLRQIIAKYKYELELVCLRRDDLMVQKTKMIESMEKHPDLNHGYALDILNSNYNMAVLEVERHKIELRQLNSQLK